jgi:hypothetical protein
MNGIATEKICFSAVFMLDFWNNMSFGGLQLRVRDCCEIWRIK